VGIALFGRSCCFVHRSTALALVYMPAPYVRPLQSSVAWSVTCLLCVACCLSPAWLARALLVLLPGIDTARGVRFSATYRNTAWHRVATVMPSSIALLHTTGVVF
jgi:hypothetical protein